MPLISYKGKTTFYDRTLGICCAPGASVALTEEQARIVLASYPELFEAFKTEEGSEEQAENTAPEEQPESVAPEKEAADPSESFQKPVNKGRRRK